jgi:hypothetical protein
MSVHVFMNVPEPVPEFVPEPSFPVACPRRAVASALACVLALLVAPATAGDGGEPEYVVIRAERVITVDGATHAPGMVVIEDGKVRAVGRGLEYPKSAKVIDASRETVMPGLILARSRHGLSRYSRSGLRGAQTAAGEVGLAEVDFEDFLEAGYTTVGFVPDGSGIPGSASVYRTGGEEGSRLLRQRAYLRVTMSSPASHKAQLRQALEKARKEIEKVKKARQEWEKKQKEAREKAAKGKQTEKKPPEKTPPEKRAPAPGPGKGPPAAEKKASSAPEQFKPPPIDPNVKPLVDLIEKKGGAAVVFELARASDLHHLDSVLEDFPEVKARSRYYLALRGGGSSYRMRYRGSSSSGDYFHVADELGEREALVMLEPLISRIPYTVNRISLPADLARAGCDLVFLPRSDVAREYLYVRTRVAMLVRAGLTRETALAALTLNPARLLGLDDRLGSLTKGKDADIIFLTGDPFETESRVTRVLIGGKVVWEEEK